VKLQQALAAQPTQPSKPPDQHLALRSRLTGEAAEDARDKPPTRPASPTPPPRAHAAQVLREALDRIFATGLDDKVRAQMPSSGSSTTRPRPPASTTAPHDPAVLRSNAVDQPGQSPHLHRASTPTSSPRPAASPAAPSIAPSSAPTASPAKIAVDPPHRLRPRRKRRRRHPQSHLPASHQKRPARRRNPRPRRPLPHLLQAHLRSAADNATEESASMPSPAPTPSAPSAKHSPRRKPMPSRKQQSRNPSRTASRSSTRASTMSQQFLKLHTARSHRQRSPTPSPQTHRCSPGAMRSGVSALMWSIYSGQTLVRDFLLVELPNCQPLRWTYFEAAAAGDRRSSLRQMA
jgi:hypothetical protein